MPRRNPASLSATHVATRRRLLGGALAAAAVGAAPGASVFAQAAYPARPVSLMVPFPPGSATDAIARALAPQVSKVLGQQLIVENRPGAAGTMATGIVAQSGNPDGYQIAIAPATVFKVPHMQKVPWNPLNDLTYIMGFSGYTFALVVPESSPWKTFDEFIAYAKANPGKINVGTSGAASTGHAATMRLSQKTGADLNHIPFKGGAEVLQAFIGGHINAVLDGGWAQVEKQAKGRVLLAFTAKRMPRLPDVPTAIELGIQHVARSPIGLVGPKGMDPKIVQTLHDAFKGALSDPTYRRYLETYDLEDAYLSGADWQALGQRMWVDERKILEELGMVPKQ
jgi:tripartite-type tricarboxylate transporter receptor subunit TctC